jgi:hypothetical protein
VGKREVVGLLDCGAQVSVMSGDLFDSLSDDGLELLHIPVVNCILSSAFGKESTRIKKQALVEFKIGDDQFEVTMMIAPKLAAEMILGINFFYDYFFLFPKMPHGFRRASTNSFHLPRSTASLVVKSVRSFRGPLISFESLLATVWGISPTTGRPVESLTASGPSWFLSFWVNSHCQVYSVLRRRVLAFAPLSFSYWCLIAASIATQPPR